MHHATPKRFSPFSASCPSLQGSVYGLKSQPSA
jgi:hypothetical protein